MALFNFPFLNPEMSAVETMLTHPSVVLGLGDSGAHCGMIMDASLPTSFLTYWIRERGLFDIQSAIHKLTLEPANLFGIRNRGILKAGAGRYIQRASGYTHTFVNGQLFMQHGEHAGAFVGSMLRGNTQ